MPREPILDLLNRPSYLPDVQAHTGSTYSPHVAALSALASLGAYQDAGGQTLRRLVAQRLELPLADVQCEPITAVAPALFIDTSAYFVRIPARDSGRYIVILVFRGTNFLGQDFMVDVFTDAKAAPVTFPAGTGATVHAGFIAAADFVWSELMNKIGGDKGDASGKGFEATYGKHAEKIERLYIAGHSLGGAIALLAAARLWSQDVSRTPRVNETIKKLRDSLQGVYTFGQPMVGDRQFAAWCESQSLSKIVYRHLYQNDIIPRTPPLSTGRFSHVGGKEWRGTEDQAFAEQPAKSWQVLSIIVAGLVAVQPFLFSTLRFLNRIPYGVSFDDHQPENYWRTSELGVGSARVSLEKAGDGTKAGATAVNKVVPDRVQVACWTATPSCTGT